MATKTTGAELRAFYNDDAYWQKSDDTKSDDIWHEELVLEVNGVEQSDDFSISNDLKDEDQVKIVYGHVLSSRDDFADRSFESFFKAWRKQQNTVYLSVAVPKEKLDAVRAAILAAGGSIK
ncbi:hypothetical protein L4Z64_001261 [Pseudomonas aeruginosa]|nr:hypothetical protein [Pseudomonas aeruginosa]MCS8414892.1 hypothetical protein [Pseudomonas aeruginosa]MCS9764399.1 hypothetical protein [Pseudomonas aeruginosa]MCS9822439.1 hypothetical protein [Pseudomonas aeruginosa]MCT0241156.1 hypothetical protein [Pseudomonas aeruginosa]